MEEFIMIHSVFELLTLCGGIVSIVVIGVIVIVAAVNKIIK